MQGAKDPIAPSLTITSGAKGAGAIPASTFIQLLVAQGPVAV
jgi:hypothetical protein